MVLSTSSWNCTGKLADTDEDGEVTQPYKYETVDETGRAATVMSSIAVGNIKNIEHLLREAYREDAAVISAEVFVTVTQTYTSKVSQVHINPHESPVIDTSPKRR
jgi:hypothetical protein